LQNAGAGRLQQRRRESGVLLGVRRQGPPLLQRHGKCATASLLPRIGKRPAAALHISLQERDHRADIVEAIRDVGRETIEFRIETIDPLVRSADALDMTSTVVFRRSATTSKCRRVSAAVLSMNCFRFSSIERMVPRLLTPTRGPRFGDNLVRCLPRT
jgi:hypothetical protein